MQKGRIFNRIRKAASDFINSSNTVGHDESKSIETTREYKVLLNSRHYYWPDDESGKESAKSFSRIWGLNSNPELVERRIAVEN